ncbi:unnamed protein product [Brassicogethes aeneus]|uniref:Uncharacterized protein n=1 Tax=Brassicogethes aeneus TaxID=1431903 RepID=A0A9P0B7Z6_BRAAE|nr:unnamed protein product [Brassicogethes aeneus]
MVGKKKEKITPLKDKVIYTEEQLQYNLYLDDLKKELYENLDTLEPSSFIGIKEFEKVTTIGMGTYGRVDLVKHTKNKTLHAMKIMSKLYIMQTQQLQHVLSERRLLSCINFPFIIHHDFTFKDNDYIYYVMPFIPGGDLYHQLKKEGPFGEDLTKFYAVQIYFAIEFLHHCDIIHRDVKLENLLVCANGYIKLTDLGFSKIIVDRTYTFCGTPEYLAPEIILAKGYGKSVDWWALGVLLYEMTVGKSPFASTQTIICLEKIVKCRYSKEEIESPELQNLIDKLIQVDLSKRLGNLVNGCLDIKNHAWFKDISFKDVSLQVFESPRKPTVLNEEDTKNFDSFEDVYMPSTDLVLYESEFSQF